MQIPTASSKTNLSETSQQTNVQLDKRLLFSVESPKLYHTNTVSVTKTQSQLPGNETQAQTGANALSFSKEKEDSDSAKLCSETPDSLVTSALPVIVSTESNPAQSILHQLDPLTPNLPQSDYCDESPDVDHKQYYDLSPQGSENAGTSNQDKPDVGLPDLTYTSKSDLSNGQNETFLAKHGHISEEQPLDIIFQPSQTYDYATEICSLMSFSKMDDWMEIQTEEGLPSLCVDYSADILQTQDNKPCKDSTYSQHVDVLVSAAGEDTDRASFEHVALETVSSRFFGFEELIPETVDRSIDDDKPRPTSLHSQESVTPVDAFDTRATSLESEQALSPSDDENSIPPVYEDASTTFDKMPVHAKAESPALEFSDTEAYFDCQQAASDSSETEPEELELRTRSHQQHPKEQEKVFEQTLLSSGSEDYEDSPFTLEPLYNLDAENYEQLDSSDEEEFTLCEAPQQTTICEMGAKDSDEDNDSLSRVRWTLTSL